MEIREGRRNKRGKGKEEWKGRDSGLGRKKMRGTALDTVLLCGRKAGDAPGYNNKQICAGASSAKKHI
jgi:hypothetical protein